jgi:segregation and condensation protein A
MDSENNNNLHTETYIPRTREYYAKLSEYEGPLDILLHFVKEDELNIYDIPISKITKDFLGYIDFIQSLDIELAGEFLLMAAELMKIKARMLLPQVNIEGEEIEEDPRMVLVRKLLEYKRFKDATEDLKELETEAQKMFGRKFFESDPREYETKEGFDPSLKSLTIFNLIKGYKAAVLGVKKEIVHPIELLTISPEMQRDFVMNTLTEKNEVDFHEMIRSLEDKMTVICTFLALLQLALEGFLELVVNKDNLSQFILRRRIHEQNISLN